MPMMWRTGHSLVKARLKETGAPLAGEMSGHIFFNDRWYGFDDGMYAGARLLELLAQRGGRPGEVVEHAAQPGMLGGFDGHRKRFGLRPGGGD